MGMKFTPEQQRVIELHNSNILVSAAAGSGKTAVLVERIIRMICDGEHPADIDRLLIVTFTNAAAAEMRERIAAGIAVRLEADPGNVLSKLQRTFVIRADRPTYLCSFTPLIETRLCLQAATPCFYGGVYSIRWSTGQLHPQIRSSQVRSYRPDSPHGPI